MCMLCLVSLTTAARILHLVGRLAVSCSVVRQTLVSSLSYPPGFGVLLVSGGVLILVAVSGICGGILICGSLDFVV